MVIKGASTKRLWANKYNGLGGHIEQGEDILSAARRELSEETGLSTHLNLCGMVMVNTGGNIGVGIFVFTGEYRGGEAISSNEGTLEWVPVSELGDKPVVEDVRIFLERIINMHPGDPIFFGYSFYDSDDRLVVQLSP